MKRFFVLLLFVTALSTSVCRAQNPTISVDGEIEEMTTDLDASTYFPKTDQNDNKCALVKVTPSQKLRSPLILEVGGLGVVSREEKSNGEIWFYVPAQVKNLSFKCAGYETPKSIPAVFKEGKVFRIKLNVTSPKQTQEVVEEGEHIAFKGVPIDGTLSQYTAAMRKAGFKQLTTWENGSATLQGDFAGFKGCTLRVSTISNHDLVCTIDVSFPQREQWGELYGDYSNLKSMLTQKYGKPSSCVERFDYDYIDDDNDRMYNTKLDRCKYITTYKTPKGTITLHIDHNSVYSCFVRLTYSDKINSSAVRNTAINDL